MSDLKQAGLLLGAAERDLTALRGMTDATVFADEIFGFHVQQAVEKLFKAWLAMLGKTYPTTHNLARLLEMLNTHDVETEGFDELVEYTPYAVQFRYSYGEPNSIPLTERKPLKAYRRCWQLFGGSKKTRISRERKSGAWLPGPRIARHAEGPRVS